MFNRSAKAAPAVKPVKELGVFGIAAEFDSAEKLVHAAERARDAGYVTMDAYTPIPVHGLDEALGFKPTRLPWLVLAGGLAGASGMFGFMVWVNMVNYPINVGGRPLFSWPALVPITFEGMVLVAAFCAVFGLFTICGLPRFHHPVFNIDRFGRASTDLFFLCIETADRNFDAQKTRAFMESLGATAVSEVSN